MLVNVVAIPLDHRPIELLPPRPRNREPVADVLLNAAIADGSKEETLQIPIADSISEFVLPFIRAGS